MTWTRRSQRKQLKYNRLNVATFVQVHTLRITLRTVPGTVPEVVLDATAMATLAVICGVTFTLVRTAMLTAVPAIT